VKERILQRLKDIETRYEVRILYACESGSRAWGFESKDSDWDVRFIYLSPLTHYLSIVKPRDVIEEPGTELDINGWDITKALGLLYKSNPALLEWFDSPHVYIDLHKFSKDIAPLAVRYFSPRSCLHHYVSMAKHNFREHMRSEKVKLKKYLYIMRPILACMWLECGFGKVPMRLMEIVEGVLPQGDECREALAGLILAKKRGQELGEGDAIPCLQSLIEATLHRMEHHFPNVPDTPWVNNFSPLNDLLRQTINHHYELSIS
jgi:predicted nucleotidyltransferase